MTRVSVDLDETIVNTHLHYRRAAEWFGEYMSSYLGIRSDVARQRRREIGNELFEQHGTSWKRYPESFVRTLHDLVDDPDELHEYRVRILGESVYRPAGFYQEQGFRDGAEAFLDAVEPHAELHLVTAGEEIVQQPKIEGLNLDNWFDDYHYTGFDGKDSVLTELKTEGQEVVHVGNSWDSDVAAAARADVHCIYTAGYEWRQDQTESDYTGDGVCISVDSMHEAKNAVMAVLNATPTV